MTLGKDLIFRFSFSFLLMIVNTKDDEEFLARIFFENKREEEEHNCGGRVTLPKVEYTNVKTNANEWCQEG